MKVGDMLAPQKLLSPAQMEKLLPKAHRALIEPLVERPPGAHTLVRDEDRRPAATTSGFTAITNN